MAHHHQTQVIFRSDAIQIEDCTCRPSDCSPGSREVSDGHYIVFVRRGSFEKRSGARRALSTPATFAFFNPGEEYRVAHPVGHGDDCTAIRFDAEALAGLAEDAEISIAEDLLLPAVSRIAAPPVLFMEHWQLLIHAKSRNVDAVALEEQAITFVSLALSSALINCSTTTVRSPVTTRAHELLVSRAVEFIASTFCESHSIAAISSEVGTSPYHLCRVFRASTGYSICDFRMQLRLREAMQRLRGGEKDLLGLSLDLGFCHHGHFGKHFRNSFGVAPSQLRMKWNSKQAR